MKKFLIAIVLACGLTSVSDAQNIVVNYGYGPVVVTQAPVVQQVPVVVYKPVVVYQPVQVLVPVVQQIPAPVYTVPEVRRSCWNWIHPQPIYYYGQ